MERRNHPRLTVFSKAGLRSGETGCDILLLDMSRTGARVLLPQGEGLEMGQMIAIKLGVLPAFVGKVTRLDDRVAGIALVDKQHPSVVESVSQYCRKGDLGEMARRA